MVTGTESAVNEPGAATDLYLELLKRALLGELIGSSEKLVPVDRPRLHTRLLQQALSKRDLVLTHKVVEDPSGRQEGRIWPIYALTMIGRPRLDNLQDCIQDVISNDVPGDCIETGVWRGGASMFMRAMLNIHGQRARRVWVADSFQGLPPPDPDYPADHAGTFHLQDALAVSLEQVQDHFKRFDLLDDGVVFLKGWFSDTLPNLSDTKWSIVRLDGDMYKSTMDALTSLYPNLSVGGWVIVDDYSIDACKQAVQDYRSERGITEEIRPIDWSGICWRRES